MHSVTVWFLCLSFVIIFSVPAPTKTSPGFNQLSWSFMSSSFNCRTDFPTNISSFMKHARKLMESCLCWSCSKWIWGCFDSKRHTYFFSCGKDHELTPTYKLSDAQDLNGIDIPFICKACPLIDVYCIWFPSYWSLARQCDVLSMLWNSRHSQTLPDNWHAIHL